MGGDEQRVILRIDAEPMDVTRFRGEFRTRRTLGLLVGSAGSEDYGGDESERGCCSTEPCSIGNHLAVERSADRHSNKEHRNKQKGAAEPEDHLPIADMHVVTSRIPHE